MEHQRDPEETMVYGDRGSVLGNGHRMQEDTDAERTRVIELFRAELDADWERHGARRKEIEKLAKRVRNGEQIALGCWCKPKACHLDLVLAKMKELL